MANLHNKENGFSLLELIIVVAIVLLIATIAIPNMLKARMSANEASAVSTLRSIATAEWSYKITNSTTGFIPLADLGPSGAGLVDTNIASGNHNGYTFTITSSRDAFLAVGTPNDFGSTGVRTFCTDTPGKIYYSVNGDQCIPLSSSPLAD